MPRKTDASANTDKTINPAPDAPAAPEGEADPEERRKRIELAAYLNAEKRGFQQGWEMDDWLAAERQEDERRRRNP